MASMRQPWSEQPLVDEGWPSATELTCRLADALAASNGRQAVGEDVVPCEYMKACRARYLRDLARPVDGSLQHGVLDRWRTEHMVPVPRKKNEASFWGWRTLAGSCLGVILGKRVRGCCVRISTARLEISWWNRQGALRSRSFHRYPGSFVQRASRTGAG